MSQSRLMTDDEIVNSCKTEKVDDDYPNSLGVLEKYFDIYIFAHFNTK